MPSVLSVVFGEADTLHAHRTVLPILSKPGIPKHQNRAAYNLTTPADFSTRISPLPRHQKLLHYTLARP